MRSSTETAQAYQNTFADRHFLGRLCEDLSDLIAAQSTDLLEREGISIPSKSCSLMIAIAQCQPASAKALSVALDRSHQLVSQKLPKLVKLNLIECEVNEADQREKLYKLTREGREQIERFQLLQGRLEQCYKDLFDEVGEVSKTVGDAINALKERPLIDRVAR